MISSADRVSVYTVTSDFLFASIIASIGRSQDHFEKLFQKLLFRDRIINTNFHSWKGIITKGKMQLNCFRNRCKIPTKSKLVAKSWLLKQFWGKCLWEWYLKSTSHLSGISATARFLSPLQLCYRVFYLPVESLGVLRYAGVPNSTWKQKLAFG